MADEKESKVKKEKMPAVKKEKVPAVKKEKPVTAKKEIKKEKPSKKDVSIPKASDMDVAKAFESIRFVLMTEKSVRIVEAQNKLVFIARRDARRDEIKKAVEDAFGSPVVKVTTMIDQSGRKKAFVKFRNAGAAGDIAIKLGVI